MATLPNRYLEDLTGTSPNNKVVGDVYQLSAKDTRAVATRFGPFYGPSMVVYLRIEKFVILSLTIAKRRNVHPSEALRCHCEVLRLYSVLSRRVYVSFR